MARAAAKRLYEPSWKTLPAGCAKDACAGYEERISHLIAAGNLGLMLAADRFDPDRGVCFATAAKYSIRRRYGQRLGST
jgi:DNA-directed RNA polymerase specialized sigma subunit